MSRPYLLYTMTNSPYSDKIRAFLRYKRVPLVEHLENAETRFTVLQARTGKTMVPVVITPGDEAVNDSTTIAARVEAAVPEPPTRWSDAAADAAAMLLEDYADEWLVRIMLSSRWYHEADAAQNAAIIANGMTHGVYGLEFQRAARDFPPSIVSTLPKMGATPANAAEWYAMLPPVLDALASALAASPFLAGSSPHQVDFAFYGQLNQIRRDPTGSGWIAAGPEAVRDWLDRVEKAATGALATTPAARGDLAALAPLVETMASTYLRMQVANALAVEAGAAEVTATLGGGHAFHAAPARYSAKLLAANLDTLEGLLASGSKLPDVLGRPVLAELAPLARAASPLLASRPHLSRALAA